MPFVVDASTTMTWCFDDETTAETDAILEELRTSGGIVPTIWPLEVANVLLIAERQNRITESDLVRLTRILHALPITIDRSGMTEAFGVVVTLARAYRLSTYDAAYLELAMRQGLPLATHDRQLRAAATRVGVPLL